MDKIVKCLFLLISKRREIYENSNVKLALFRKLIHENMPYFEKFLLMTFNNFDKIIGIDMKSINEQNRCVEDLNDILCRNQVLIRLNSEKRDLEKQFYKAKAALDMNKPLSQEQIIANRNKAVEIAQKLKICIYQIMESEKRMNLFMFRRIKSAIIRFGKSLENESSLESAIFNSLCTVFRSIRDHAHEPNKIVLEKGKKKGSKGKKGKGKKGGKLKPDVEQEDEDDIFDGREIDIDGFLYDASAERTKKVSTSEDTSNKPLEFFEFDEDGVDFSVKIPKRTK